MNPISVIRLLPCALALVSAGALAQGPAEVGTLRAGAARVDITPAPDAALPMGGYAGRTQGFTAIHDPLNVRAIVVDDGTTEAALVACELLFVTDTLWKGASTRIVKETGIPLENILMAGVHTHAAPSAGLGAAGHSGAGDHREHSEPIDPDAARRRAEYYQKVEDAVVAAVLQAKANLQPAKIGYGTGKANVNSNRRAQDGSGGLMLGNDPDGVSDKTVAVIRFDTMSDEPFAIFSNYSVHGTVLGSKNMQISSDLPGATARYVEKHYGGTVISPWTSGAAGDQDPIYRVGVDFRNVAALGQILGDEVIRVADGIKTTHRARIRGFQKVVTCPGKRTLPGKEYKTEDTGPVSIRLSLLVIDDIAFAGVSGEVLTNISLRLKKESSFNHMLMVTHCNGNSGYLPDDAAYQHVSYEIMSTRVKPGYAENAIVNGLLDLMNQVL